MPDTPPQADSTPASGPSPVPLTPKVSVAPAPAPAAEGREAPAPSDDDESGSVRIGEVFDFGAGGSFTVKERLGRGGMGEVYRAEYVTPAAPKLVRAFALKVLRPYPRPQHERTFIDEVHLLSLLRHESIARYHTFFVDKGRKVLVMELVEGRSLLAILELARRKGRTLSEAVSLELLAQIAEALGYAHAAKDEAGRPLNIVHRDVSPANIMVTSAGFAKLVDFGVAKADLEDRTHTRTGAINIRGKLPYLSPEQVKGKPLDGRSDLFALGSVLVEMLIGGPPFGRMLGLETLGYTANVTPRYVDLITRGLSRKVRAICRKALAREPAERFADGHEMAAAMLANHVYEGPAAVQKEIAGLEALPDATPEAVEREATTARKAKWPRRALVVACALAVAVLPAHFLRRAYDSKPAAPAASPPAAVAAHEQPLSPFAKAEEGIPTVKDEMKSQVPAPAGGAAARSRTKKVLPVLVVAAASAGCVHIQTGTHAGDCTHAVVRDFEGKRVPDVMHVTPYEGPWAHPFPPKSLFCTGEWEPNGLARDEPCPVYEGPVVMRASDPAADGDWYGPGKGSFYYQPPLLNGKTSIFPATGTYNTHWGHGPRNVSGRMTALITEIQTWDGKTVPVCGVLFGNDGKEGVPIFSSPYYSTPTGGSWGDATVHFFWPSHSK